MGCPAPFLILGGLFLFATATNSFAQLNSRVYASGFSAPVAFVQDPSDRTVQYVVEQGGLIRVIRHGVVQPPPFLDLTGVVRTGGEQGLLGLAFPSDYGASGRFYVYFTAPSFGETDPVTGRMIANHSTVARFKRSADNPFVADPSTRRDMVWSGGLAYIPHPFTNHNGGNLAFGPDGFLYIGTGDGGAGDDPDNNAQTPSSLLGKMLRIDVSVADGDPKGFQIPADNPFQPGRPGSALGARPEIWAFGLRNPWRWSFDEPAHGGTGALLVGDVGQGSFEEVNYEPAGRGGRNYGWAIREGAHAHLSRPTAFQPLTDPIHDYGRTDGNSVTGGYVYRGLRLGPAFRGRYFFGDFGTGRIWSLGLAFDADGEARVANILEHTGELGAVSVSSFGTDADGELYILDLFGGRILKIDGDQPSVAADIDGDFKSDLVVWRPTDPTDGTWYALRSSTGYAPAAATGTQFGSQAAGDTPLMADIDGDGVRDLVTWRGSTGVWSWRTSSTGYASGGSKQWGIASLGDVPLLGDVDGDRKADLIVWRASTGTFFWLPSSTNYDYPSGASKQWGSQSQGDVPMIGDFDGDRRADLVVWRATTGVWFWLTSSTGYNYANRGVRQWGIGSEGDIPRLGDFDGDGRSDLAVWRASTGTWFWIVSSTAYAYGDQQVRQWGSQAAGDVPLVGDFDGDGRADLAVWRPSNGIWSWLTSSSGYSPAAAGVRQWGIGSLGDVPMTR